MADQKQFKLSILMEMTDKMTAPLNNMVKKFKQTSEKITAIGKSMFAKVTLPLLGLGGMALKSSADIEQLAVSFESLTGGAENAQKLMSELIDFTAKTPFQLEGVGKAAKQLLAAQVPATELRSKLKYLGDIAAGANVPLSDMASIFGKAKAKGKAMTEEILQLSDRGIPVIDVLAKQMNVSKEEIFKMASKGKISFKILEDALISMSNKGGVFADQMKKQSSTLAGIFSTLKDNLQLAFGELGNTLVKTFDLKNVMNKIITQIQKFVKWFKKLNEENPRLVKIALTFLAILAAMGPIAIVLGGVVKSFAAFASIGKGILVVVKGVMFLVKAMKILGAVMAANPILLIITAIAVAALLVIKYWKPIKKFFIKLWDAIGKRIKSFKKMIVGVVKGIKGVFVSIFSGIKDFFVGIFDSIFGFFKKVWDFIKRILGLTKEAKVSKAAATGLTARIPGVKGQKIKTESETDINIRVSAYDNSEIVWGGVDRRKGDANVNLNVDSEVGMFGPVGT